MSDNNMAELTEALAAALVQRGELQAENAKLRKLHEYDEYSLTRLRAELSSLQELYADRDRDLAFEFKRANDAEAKAEAQSEAMREKWLSPIEAAGLKAEIARLRAALRNLAIEAETFAIVARFQGTPLTQLEQAIEAARKVCYGKTGAPADTEATRLRAGIAQFAAAINEPGGWWAWDEMTDAQQEAYNALMAL